MIKKLNLKEQKNELTKREILTAAAKLFSLNGFNEVTMEDIANEADVSRTTIYNHFKKKNRKEEIYFELGINGFRMTNSFAEKNILTVGTGMEQFLRLCERAFEAIHTFPLIFTILSDYFLRVNNSKKLNFEEFHDEIKETVGDNDKYNKMKEKFINETYLLDFYIQLQKSAEIWLTAVANGKKDGTIKKSLANDHIVHFMNLTITGIIEQTILRQPTLQRIKMDEKAIIKATLDLIKTFLIN